MEFFLITSGFFMAKSVNKYSYPSENIGKETWLFLWRKLKQILPYHIAFNLMAFAIGIIRGHSLEENINRLSCLLFLPAIGFNDQQWMLGAEWYIGYMLFAMLVIYPFIRKWNVIVMEYIAPVLAIVLYGYLALNYQTVMGSNRMLETFAGLLLGISVYSLSANLKTIIEKSDSVWFKRFVGMYPLAIILCFLLYLNTSIGTSIQPFMVLILASGLAVSFSEKGIVSQKGVLNNNVVYWLGKMSLPIYMIQNITRMVALAMFKEKPEITLYIIESVITIICGIVGYYILAKISSSIKRKINA